MYSILHALANAPCDDSGDSRVTGQKLQDKTGLFPPQINNVVEILHDSGNVGILETAGTHPFNFRSVSITAKGRLEYENIKEKEFEISNAKMAAQTKNITKEEITSKSNRVFIVHGRDEENTKALKEILIEWGFDVVILSEKPHMGRTLIEKLIDNIKNVDHAFVLLTPDDVGGLISDFNSIIPIISGLGTLQYASSGGGEMKRVRAKDIAKDIERVITPRARQNVIFEYGLLMGSLGRQKVCLLKKGNVDFPTDILGIGYIQFNEKITEQI